MLNLVGCLLDKVNAQNVRYCHWKSNFSLAYALSGEMDLDLLVDRKSLPQVEIILRELGCKAAVSRWGAEMPSTYHYYGLDSRTGLPIHIHLVSSILTGESFVKSHLFPFEPMLLENTYRIGQMRVTSKPAELVLFVLRVFIKHGSPLDLMYSLGTPANLKAELCWLLAGIDMAEALSLLKKYCPVIDEQLFVRCIDTVKTNDSLVKRLILARQIRRRLHVYARFAGFKRCVAYIQLLWGQIQRHLSGNKKDKVLQRGGAVVAFVGPEAAGKSTLVAECGRWLGDLFAVGIVHVGKPPSSWLTIPVNIVLPLTRIILPWLRTSRLEGHGTPDQYPTQSQPQDNGVSSIVYALRAVSLAWDRRQLIAKVQRYAANGEIVICDRYPSEMVGVIDSRRLRENPNKGRPLVTLYNWLARLEDRQYREIPPPDIVVRLIVSAETAKKRNRRRTKHGRESDAYLESRHRRNQTWHMSGTKYIFDMDTERPLAQTILNVKKAIWKSL